MIVYKVQVYKLKQYLPNQLICSDLWWSAVFRQSLSRHDDLACYHMARPIAYYVNGGCVFVHAKYAQQCRQRQCLLRASEDKCLKKCDSYGHFSAKAENIIINTICTRWIQFSQFPSQTLIFDHIFAFEHCFQKAFIMQNTKIIYTSI